MPPRKATAPKQVNSTVHSDKRTNIPTEELRDFVADAERNPSGLFRLGQSHRS